MDSYVAELDEQTTRLILQLLLQDLDQLSSNEKYKDLKDVPANLASPLANHENDLKAMTGRDRAQSVAHAVRPDSQIVKDIPDEENQASEDLLLDLETYGTATTAPSVPMMTDTAAVNGGDNDNNDILLEKMSSIHMDDVDVEKAPEDDIYSADPPSAYSISKTKTPAVKRHCCTCDEAVAVKDMARAPCNHEYCRGCLGKLFTLSLKDESLFPPRCCRMPIPAYENLFFLGWDLLSLFEARKIEMETTDRTYCHIPECSKFIPPDNIEQQIARCVACTARTCSVCKAAAHVGDCPKDPAKKELDDLADKKGWRRCNGCHSFVELSSGCNHISKSMIPPSNP